MKNLKWVLPGILLVCMHLTSCKKDADQQHQQNAPAENKEKLFEKSLTIYNADKTKSTTLRLSAASKELLDKSLERTEFTLVKTPVSAEATGLDTSTTRSDGMGYVASSSAQNAPQSTNGEQALPGDARDAIQVDFPSASKKAEPITIKVKSKDLNNSTMRSATEQAQSSTWWDSYFSFRSTGINDVVIRYYGDTYIDVYWYWYWFYDWHYSGYSNRLYFNKSAEGWGKNCKIPTGFDVYFRSGDYYWISWYPSKYC
jgi:hypothetical protein